MENQKSKLLWVATVAVLDLENRWSPSSQCPRSPYAILNASFVGLSGHFRGVLLAHFCHCGLYIVGLLHLLLASGKRTLLVGLLGGVVGVIIVIVPLVYLSDTDYDSGQNRHPGKGQAHGASIV